MIARPEIGEDWRDTLEGAVPNGRAQRFEVCAEHQHHSDCDRATPLTLLQQGQAESRENGNRGQKQLAEADGASNAGHIGNTWLTAGDRTD